MYDRIRHFKGDDNGLLPPGTGPSPRSPTSCGSRIDYQGGNNAYGATSFGASWAFAKNVSVILGYDVYNNKDRAGQNTATIQVDINFP